MAESIAQDPNFAQMAQAMQANLGGMGGGAAGGGVSAPATPGRSPNSAAEPNGVPNMAGLPGMAGGMPGGVDPAAYADMMSGVLQNPQFVEMAEKLGQQIMQVTASVVLSCKLTAAVMLIATRSARVQGLCKDCLFLGVWGLRRSRTLRLQTSCKMHCMYTAIADCISGSAAV